MTTNPLEAVLTDRPIAFHPLIARVSGGAVNGLIMSQLLYWHGATGHREFWKTDEEIRSETGTSRRELTRARRELVARGFISVTRRGVPCTHHYRVNITALAEAIAAVEACNLDCTKRAIQTARNVQSRLHETCSMEPRNPSQGKELQPYTEITTENTTEKVHSEQRSRPLNDETHEVVEAWNAMAAEAHLPRARYVTGKRLAALRSRWRDSRWREAWREAVRKIPSSPFLCGENPRGWRANIDWFLRPDTVTKILEGQYDTEQDRVGGRDWMAAVLARWDREAKIEEAKREALRAAEEVPA